MNVLFFFSSTSFYIMYFFFGYPMSTWRHGFVLNASVLVLVMIPSRLLVRLACIIGLFWGVYCACD